MEVEELFAKKGGFKPKQCIVCAKPTPKSRKKKPLCQEHQGWELMMEAMALADVKRCNARSN